MIIIRYCGGLGNQMYQYAMQIALEVQYPGQEFKADIYHYNLLNEHNGFELPVYFGIEFQYADYSEIRQVYNGLIPKRFYKAFPFAFRKKIAHQYQNIYWSIRNRLCPQKDWCTIQDDGYHGFEGKDLSKGDWYIRGMWQDIQWFDRYRAQIISKLQWDLELNEEEKHICDRLEAGRAIAIHVRGRDFLTKMFDLCGPDYYRQALSLISDKGLPLYIFTDDVIFAKTLFDSEKTIKFISHGIDKSVIDMYMMSKARYLILSNSTFAFWSAYLNETKENQIICPRYSIFDKKGYKEYKGRKGWDVVDNSDCLSVK